MSGKNIIIICLIITIIGLLIYYENSETFNLSNIPFFPQKYSIKIYSNTTWMMTAYIEANGEVRPIIYSHTGNYTLRDIPKLESVDIAITAADFGLVSNRYFKVEILKGNKIIFSKESNEFGLECRWRK